MDSPVGTCCEACQQGVGCKIFDRADIRCKDFRCAYNQAERAPLGLRPDKCKVIFERMTDTIMHGTLHPKHQLSGVASNQVRAFLGQGFSVIIESLGCKPNIYPAKDANPMDVRRTFEEKVRTSHGRSNV